MSGDRNLAIGLMIDEANPSKKHLGRQKTLANLWDIRITSPSLAEFRSSPVESSTNPKKIPRWSDFSEWFDSPPGHLAGYISKKTFKKKTPHQEGTNVIQPSFQGEDRSGRVFQHISNTLESWKKVGPRPREVAFWKPPTCLNPQVFVFFFVGRKTPFPKFGSWGFCGWAKKQIGLSWSVWTFLSPFRKGWDVSFGCEGWHCHVVTPQDSGSVTKWWRRTFRRGRKSCLTITILGADSHIDT